LGREITEGCHRDWFCRIAWGSEASEGGDDDPAQPAHHDDLDFFPFPEVDSNIGMDTLDAPIDGFMLSKEPKNLDLAQELLKFVSTGKAQNLYLKSDPNFISPAKDADTSAYTPLQKKAAELVASAKSFSQFLDRDTRPDFASTVMIPALQSFIKDPTTQRAS
jgi:multiple sugar transport system substrate-binding protein